MKRREFIALIGGAAAWPIMPRAQQIGKVHRVGLAQFIAWPTSEVVGPDPINPAARAFVHGLRDLGYVEGRNLVLERRSAEGRIERAPEIIRELVSIKADVIVTDGVPMTRAAKEVTQSVPIVMVGVGDPVKEGLIESLARPGGNITGLAALTGLENVVKRMELLKELLPGLSRVAVLLSKGETAAGWDQISEAAGRELSLKVLNVEATPTDYASVFALITREHPEALLVHGNAVTFANRHLISEFAAKNRLPAIYAFREHVAAGGLIAHGPNIADISQRAAGYVDRILKGAKPGDLPVEQPNKLELVINLKTAKALGLTIPPSVLIRADEVIE